MFVAPARHLPCRGLKSGFVDRLEGLNARVGGMYTLASATTSSPQENRGPIVLDLLNIALVSLPLALGKGRRKERHLLMQRNPACVLFSLFCLTTAHAHNQLALWRSSNFCGVFDGGGDHPH